MGETPEQQLREGLAAGSESAYAELYDRWGGRLFRAAWGLTGSREAAEDAVQDVFTALFRGRRGLARVERLEAYLFAALRHAAARRAGRRRGTASMDAATLVHAAPAAAVPAADPRLEEALRRLPPDQREVVSLKVDAGLTFEAIGEALGISANTAASRYRYALEKLRSTMKERSDA